MNHHVRDLTQRLTLNAWDENTIFQTYSGTEAFVVCPKICLSYKRLFGQGLNETSAKANVTIKFGFTSVPGGVVPHSNSAYFAINILTEIPGSISCM